MEQMFEKFKSEGKNTVDGLVQWMKDAEVIDGATVTEDQARASLGDAAKVELGTFKQTLEQLASGAKKDVEGFTRRLSGVKDQIHQMDKTFEDLIKSGKNGVESIVGWMQEAKVIEKTKEAGEKATKMFSGVKDQGNVTVDEFKGVVTAMAAEQNCTFDELSKMLTEGGPKFMNALGAAASAFKENMK